MTPTPAREWPGLTARDQSRLTTFKYCYVLMHGHGFTVAEARRLCFVKYLARTGRYAADQGAAHAPTAD